MCHTIKRRQMSFLNELLSNVKDYLGHFLCELLSCVTFLTSHANVMRLMSYVMLFLSNQWFQSVFRCRILLLNFSMGFDIIAPYVEMLHIHHWNLLTKLMDWHLLWLWVHFGIGQKWTGKMHCSSIGDIVRLWILFAHIWWESWFHFILLSFRYYT